MGTVTIGTSFKDAFNNLNMVDEFKIVTDDKDGSFRTVITVKVWDRDKLAWGEQTRTFSPAALVSRLNNGTYTLVDPR